MSSQSMSEYSVKIGTSNQFVMLSFDGRIEPNWLGRFSVQVQDESFRASAECWDNPAGSLGIYGLRRQLQTMKRKLSGVAEFCPLEEQIQFKMSMNRLGHVAVSGVLFQHATYGSKLEFEFQLDQSYLPEIISSLRSLGV